MWDSPTWDITIKLKVIDTAEKEVPIIAASFLV